MRLLGERQVIVDCDVLQADGGTRTASICGGYVALHDALTRLVQAGTIAHHPLTAACGAISVGIVDGEPVLDLPYVEDSRAEVDMNVVMTSRGRLRRGAGHRRGPAVQPGRARRAARPSPRAGIAEIIVPAAGDGGPPAARRRARATEPAAAARVLATGQRRTRSVEIAGDPRRRRCESRWPRPDRRAGRGRRTPTRFEEQRLDSRPWRCARPPASRRWPTTRARGRRASAARPGSARPADAGEPDWIHAGPARAGRACPPAGRGLSLRLRRRGACWPDGREVVAAGTVEGTHRRRARGGAAASATTRSSCPPTATAAPSPRCPRRRSRPSATGPAPSGALSRHL